MTRRPLPGPWTLLCLGACFAFVAYTQLLGIWGETWDVSRHRYWRYDLKTEEPEDRLQACQLPRLHPFDGSVLPYLRAPQSLTCSDRQGLLSYIDSSRTLRLNQTSSSCFYQPILRPPNDDFHTDFGPELPISLENGAPILNDFVSVTCYNMFKMPIYNNIHAIVVPQPYPFSNPSPITAYNVLVVGIDSLSRLSFMRYMPQTYSYLTDKMGAVVLRGMTKVGDNTYPNLVAFLSGKESTIGIPVNGSYDQWPFIWKDFKKLGYSTLYAEDRYEISTFNYNGRQGFNNPPTEHYFRPGIMAIETSKTYRFSLSLCYGAIPKHTIQINYTRSFVKEYYKLQRPYFGFSFFVDLSHDYINRVGAADNDFHDFLSDLFENKMLERTVLVFMSDHGHRFDASRVTLMGRVEERLPFVAIYIPPELDKIHPQVKKTLQSNSGRLVSHYDMYWTMKDLYQHAKTGEKLGKMSGKNGMSLFGDIKASRTCSNAGIPEHYCTCEEESPIPLSDKRTKEAAEELLRSINLAVSIDPSCVPLELVKVDQASLLIPRKAVVNNVRVDHGSIVSDEPVDTPQKLRIVIQTRPGEALFEATLQFERGIYKLLGDISRINRYGSQSWCVEGRNDALIKLCYCRDIKS